MIKVLQNWLEIGQASNFLAAKKLPFYPTGDKNWDLYHIYNLVQSLPRTIKIMSIMIKIVLDFYF